MAGSLRAVAAAARLSLPAILAELAALRASLAELRATLGALPGLPAEDTFKQVRSGIFWVISCFQDSGKTGINILKP